MNGLLCSEATPWLYGLADSLIFSKVRAAIGLDRCRMCASGAAPISKQTLDFFMSLNLPIMEVYGMSESTGI
jgi:long-chain-fatty-acid--CoA ligase ACSBG